MVSACGGDNGGSGGTGGNGTPPDMAKSGACTDATDQAIGKPAMDAAAAACGLACYADKANNPPKMCADCLTMQIMNKTQKTLSTACNTCWTTVILCGINNCAAPCQQNGSDSPECRACTMKAGCDSGFSSCSGL
jgi:hypothetical protein